MWPEWFKSPAKGVPLSQRRTPPPSPRFACSSFKDIHTLITEEQTQYGSVPSSPTRSVFHRVRATASLIRFWAHRCPHHSSSKDLKPSISPSDNLDQPVILYFTSLRIVRKTYEDCRTVRLILRGLRIPIDERDLSMDDKYVAELQRIFGSQKLTLPIVFIGGKYTGGAEEIKALHESGELKKLISDFPFFDSDGGCGVCGGLRFVLCEECSGSRKIYMEKSGFRSCSTCNVNGLIRCPLCVPLPRRRMSM